MIKDFPTAWVEGARSVNDFLENPGHFLRRRPRGVQSNTPSTLLRAVNNAIIIIDNPCDLPWTVYAKLALPALGKALIVLTTFGVGDILRGAFRPKSVRGRFKRPRTRIGRVAGKVKPPELGNLIGRKLGGQELAAREVAGGVNLLWHVDMPIQRLLWWFLVVHVVEDFWIEWTTSILDTFECRAAATPRFLARDTPAGVAAIQGWQAWEIAHVEYARFGGSWNLSTGQIVTQPWTLVAQSKMANPHDDPIDYQMRVVTAGFPVSVVGLSPTVTIPPHGEAETSVDGQAAAGAQLGVEHRCSFKTLNGVQGSAFGWPNR